MAKIEIIEFGDDSYFWLPSNQIFRRSRLHAWFVIQKNLLKYHSKLCVRIVEAKNPEAAFNSATQASSILHLMSHGSRAGDIRSRNSMANWKSIVSHLGETDSAFLIDAFFADAWSSFYPAWIEGLSRSIQPGSSCVFIGTTRSVSFDDTSRYFKHFYNELMRWVYPGCRELRRELIMKSHQDAVKLWERDFRRKDVRKECHFRARIVESSE